MRRLVAGAFSLACLGPLVVAQTPPVPGTLTGKRIVISPSHGLYWHSTLGWIYQRPLINGLIEDVHSNEICIDHLYKFLEGAGAKVITCRERAYVPVELIPDNDGPPANYSETGTWTTSTLPGYQGLTYRFANSNPTETAAATWTAAIPTSGLYPIYVYYRAGTNRVTDALYRVAHSGGTSVVHVNQQIDGLKWNYLGSFYWFAGETAQVTLSNQSLQAGVVIADAVRIGAGFGSIVRGGSTSGALRWRECSRYWAEYCGAPSTVWDPCSTGQDNCDDVTCRPNWAEWWGADAFLSLHTNASATGTASGTSTYIYNGAAGGSATPGSALLQSLVHNRIMTDVQAFWDPTWNNQGILQANFGEVRELQTMPGILIELAFHDNLVIDNPYLHEPEFRRIGARAIYRGIAAYFNAAAPFVPEPPVQVAVQNQADGSLKVRWSLAPGATGYVVYRSPNGKAFDDGTVVPGPATAQYMLPIPAPGEVVYVKVAATNAGGVGPASEVVAARAARGGPVPALLVSGFDRLDAFVVERDNTFDFPRQHASAIAAAIEAGWHFDGANNNAVPGLVPLVPYRMVDWILGEESTADETFSSAEQATVAAYLNGGGNLFVSGSEIGWDLDALGSVADRAFYEGTLGLNYVADDANTYSVNAPAPGSFFGGLPAFTFDNGSSGTYNVDFPDVVAPASALGTTVLQYSTGGGAAVRKVAPAHKVVGLGFPFETIVQASARDAMMGRVLADMASVPIPPQAPIAVGASRAIPIRLAGSAGLPFVVTGALGISPGIPLDASRVFPLNFDILLFLLLSPGNGVLSGNVGTLDPAGQATITLSIPPVPGVNGLVFYLAGASFSGSSVQEITNWARVQVL